VIFDIQQPSTGLDGSDTDTL